MPRHFTSPIDSADEIIICTAKYGDFPGRGRYNTLATIVFMCDSSAVVGMAGWSVSVVSNEISVQLVNGV